MARILISLCLLLSLLVVPAYAQSQVAVAVSSMSTINYVQGNVTPSAVDGSSATVSLTAVATGHALVVGISTSGLTTTVNTVGDTVNTYTKRSGRTFLAGVGGTEIWAVSNATGGNITVTASYSATVTSTIYLVEYTDVSTSEFDVQNSATGTSSSPSSGAATTTINPEVIVGVGTYNASLGSYTAGTGFTIRQQNTSTTLGIAGFFQDRIVANTGSYASTGTLSASIGWTMCMATFKRKP